MDRPAIRWAHDADEWFDDLVESVPWRSERRQMYDRVVDVPRLVCFYDLLAGGHAVQPPHPVIARLRRRLNDIYAGELGEPFTTAGLCLYRNGSDSVAWHGDTIGRSRTEDTMVAIVSLGATRAFGCGPGGGAEPAAVIAPRRSAGDGWFLSANLGARRPEDVHTDRAQGEHSIPPARCAVSGLSS